jgi:hypothetical protein
MVVLMNPPCSVDVFAWNVILTVLSDIVQFEQQNLLSAGLLAS